MIYPSSWNLISKTDWHHFLQDFKGFTVMILLLKYFGDWHIWNISEEKK